MYEEKESRAELGWKKISFALARAKPISLIAYVFGRRLDGLLKIQKEFTLRERLI